MRITLAQWKAHGLPIDDRAPACSKCWSAYVPRAKSFYVCDYHRGFVDGFDAALEEEA